MKSLSQPLLARLRSLPVRYLFLPLPLVASWYAGQIALERAPDTNYWQALSLWLGAIALFLALLLPWRRMASTEDLRGKLAAVPWLEVGVVLFLTLVAFAAAAFDLVAEPNPFSGDEANFALQALEVNAGSRRNMFDTGVPFGQPTMYFFIVALSNKVFGVGILAARAPSVFFGVTVIPFTYLLLRELFDRRIAMVGAAFLAVYHFHVHFSRLGMNNISAVWVAVVTLYFAARATRTQKPLDFGLAGAAAGLSLYSYVGARVVPLVLGLYLGWVVLNNWRFLVANAGNFLVLAAGFAVAAGPQGLFFLDIPDEFYAGHRYANIYGSGWLEREQEVRGVGAATILIDQFREAFSVLFLEDERFTFYSPQAPLIDSISRWPFVAGGLYALAHVRQPRYFLLLALLILTVILGGVMVFPPPSAARLVLITPAVAGLVAIGVVATVDFMVRRRERLAVYAPGMIAAAVLVLAFINVRFYFGDYLPNERYVPGANDITFAVGDYMADVGPEYVGYVFGPPYIYGGDPTVKFIGRNRVFVDVPDGAERLPPVESDEPHATFMFVPERIEESLPIRAVCPGGEWKEFVKEFDQRVLFYAYELPDGQACVRSANLTLPLLEPDAVE